MTRLLTLLALVLGLAVPAHAQPPATTSATASRPPVILVSIDGFRADYLDRGRTPTLAALAADGVRARGMRPSFPSVTFPNHYTLVTGLVPDHHGIVGNVMADPRITPDSLFTLGDRTAVTDRRWWDEATPIWVTAQRQGVHAATLFWPGSEAAIQGMRPDLWLPFDTSLPLERRVDTVLGWLDLPPERRPGFVTLYFEPVDHEGHTHGPDSPEVDAAMTRVDTALAHLMAGLKARGIDADVVVVADHGMAAVSPDRRLFLDNLVDLQRAKVIGTGAFTGIYPASPNETHALLAAHDHMRCWAKDQIPAALHYGTNIRIPPVLCLADVGWLITTRAEVTRAKAPLAGEHGYDPTAPEMAALFVAHGPDFRHGLTVEPFDNVDVYPLLAHLLGVAPEPNDGRLDEVKDMLADSAG